MGAPTYRIRKISKLSKKDYQMQISNSFRSGSRDKLYYTQGYSTIRMKKTSDGFKLAGITYDNTITTSLRQQDLQAYAPIIKELRIGQGFAFADLGKDTDALLVTDYTYQYDPGTIAAIDATVYGLDKETGAPVEIGKVESAGTAYPLCADGQHFMYYGSGHGVAKATLTDGYTKFENVETAYEDFNSDGSSTFYYNDRVVPDDSNLTRLFNEWFGNARIIEFTIVQ